MVGTDGRAPSRIDIDRAGCREFAVVRLNRDFGAVIDPVRINGGQIAAGDGLEQLALVGRKLGIAFRSLLAGIHVRNDGVVGRAGQAGVRERAGLTLADGRLAAADRDEREAPQCFQHRAGVGGLDFGQVASLGARVGRDRCVSYSDCAVSSVCFAVQPQRAARCCNAGRSISFDGALVFRSVFTCTGPVQPASGSIMAAACALS